MRRKEKVERDPAALWVLGGQSGGNQLLYALLLEQRETNRLLRERTVEPQGTLST